MTSICVVGTGSLPGSSEEFQTASGLRSWQFSATLAQAGCDTHLVLVRDSKHSARPPADLPFEVSAVSRTEGESPEWLGKHIARISPDAVVGATSYGSLLASAAVHPRPLWIDLPGDPAAEGQARAAIQCSERPVEDALWLLHSCLRRGDRFSAVSVSQRLALLGQLGAAGRLTAANCGLDLVALIPEAIPDVAMRAPTRRSADDAFTILFSGSFNAWIDGPTLLSALEIALAADPRVRFVATGGALPGFLEEPWAEFQAAATSLRPSLRSRIELRGWCSPEELQSLEESAGCGVIPERRIAERELGGHNRGLRWMTRGVPVITSAQSDLGKELAQNNLAAIYEAGDVRALAACILQLCNEPRHAQELATRAHAWATRHRSLAATTQPLVNWALEPLRAPDLAHGRISALLRRVPQLLLDQIRLEDLAHKPKQDIDPDI